MPDNGAVGTSRSAEQYYSAAQTSAAGGTNGAVATQGGATGYTSGAGGNARARGGAGVAGRSGSAARGAYDLSEAPIGSQGADSAVRGTAASQGTARVYESGRSAGYNQGETGANVAAAQARNDREAFERSLFNACMEMAADKGVDLLGSAPDSWRMIIGALTGVQVWENLYKGNGQLLLSYGVALDFMHRVRRIAYIVGVAQIACCRWISKRTATNDPFPVPVPFNIELALTKADLAGPGFTDGKFKLTVERVATFIVTGLRLGLFVAYGSGRRIEYAVDGNWGDDFLISNKVSDGVQSAKDGRSFDNAENFLTLTELALAFGPALYANSSTVDILDKAIGSGHPWVSGPGGFGKIARVVVKTPKGGASGLWCAVMGRKLAKRRGVTLTVPEWRPSFGNRSILEAGAKQASLVDDLADGSWSDG